MTFEFLIFAILFLGIIFFKLKKKTPKQKGKFYKDGRQRNFKNFEAERRLKNQKEKPLELGGYGITASKNRVENFFKPSPIFNDERIVNDPRGIYGEAAMVALIARVCDTDKRKYVLMQNLYIPSRGGTTEIDALLLHESGIYVFESKNLSGEIFGSLEMERWNQHLNKNVEHTFHNPIRQNIGHILSLRYFLKIPHIKSHFISVIVLATVLL